MNQSISQELIPPQRNGFRSYFFFAMRFLVTFRWKEMYKRIYVQAHASESAQTERQKNVFYLRSFVQLQISFVSCAFEWIECARHHLIPKWLHASVCESCESCCCGHRRLRRRRHYCRHTTVRRCFFSLLRRVFIIAIFSSTLRFHSWFTRFFFCFMFYCRFTRPFHVR